MAGYVGSHLWAIRQKWGTDPLLFPGIIALVFNKQGQVLLGWRDQFQGWSHFGGSMELGEALTETMKREVEEETGAAVADSTFFGLISADKYKVVYPHGDVTQQVSAMFAVTLASDEVVMDEEHSRFGWFGMDEIPGDITPLTRDVLGMYEDFRRTGSVVID